MLNWLQHLFTARALERELSELRTENSALKLEIEKLKKVTHVKDEEIWGLNKRLDGARAGRPRFAEGADENPLGF